MARFPSRAPGTGRHDCENGSFCVCFLSRRMKANDSRGGSVRRVSTGTEASRLQEQATVVIRRGEAARREEATKPRLGVADDLGKLAVLKERGYLAEAEFEEQKRLVLQPATRLAPPESRTTEWTTVAGHPAAPPATVGYGQHASFARDYPE
jgi:hypothetical protein